MNPLQQAKEFVTALGKEQALQTAKYNLNQHTLFEDFVTAQYWAMVCHRIQATVF